MNSCLQLLLNWNQAKLTGMNQLFGLILLEVLENQKELYIITKIGFIVVKVMLGQFWISRKAMCAYQCPNFSILLDSETASSSLFMSADLLLCILRYPVQNLS